MEKSEFLDLKPGDIVYDSLRRRDMEVVEVRKPNRFGEGFVRYYL
jgi:hypothetical protein